MALDGDGEIMATLKQPWETQLDPGSDPYAIDDGTASGGYTPPADNSSQPTAKPVDTAPGPATSQPWMDQAATSAPSSYASPAAPQNVQDMVSGWIKNNNLTANQNDPNSLHSITQYLHQNGIDAQVDYTDQNGHTGGILVNGKPYQLINGQNQWTPLQPWQQGGSGGGGGALPNPPSIPQPNYDLGATPTWNPGQATQAGSSDFTKMLQDSYGKMIQSNQDTIDNPMSSAQFEALRQPIDKARRTALNSATGALAARGTLQGSGELANYGQRLEGELGPAFATATQNASVANANNARNAQVNTLAGGTNLSGMTGDLALRNLDQNRLWNEFLGNYGLDRAKVQAMIDQGYGDQILKLFEIQANGAI